MAHWRKLLNMLSQISWWEANYCLRTTNKVADQLSKLYFLEIATFKSCLPLGVHKLYTSKISEQQPLIVKCRVSLTAAPTQIRLHPHLMESSDQRISSFLTMEIINLEENGSCCSLVVWLGVLGFFFFPGFLCCLFLVCFSLFSKKKKSLNSAKSLFSTYEYNEVLSWMVWSAIEFMRMKVHSYVPVHTMSYTNCFGYSNNILYPKADKQNNILLCACCNCDHQVFLTLFTSWNDLNLTATSELIKWRFFFHF